MFTPKGREERLSHKLSFILSKVAPTLKKLDNEAATFENSLWK